MAKKIILSIIGILALLGAYSILNGGNKAKPTTARIDISEKTTNATPCFEVKEIPSGKAFLSADWMPRFGQQGYVIQKNNVSEEIEIAVTSDKCKINFALRGPWELKDKNDRNKGIKELWVEYTKFAINGQDIITKPTPVWHNKPIHHTINAQKGNVFNVKINWQKYYTSEQLQTKNTLDVLWLSLVALVCIIAYRFRKRIKAMPIWQKLAKLQDFDLEEIITKKWQAISPISKKSFLWIFLITNIVFIFHSVQYMWGWDDWILVKNGMRIYDMLWAGRFTGGLIQQVFGGELLPVINNIFSFTGFTFAVIYLAKYWKVPQTPLSYTLFGLFIILMPYTLSWLWHIKQTSLFWNVFFVIYALYISQKKTYTSSIIAITLIVISLGAYASIISTIAIVLLGRILMDIILEQKSIKELFHTYLRACINIVISIVIFKLILVYYDHAGRLSHGGYNTEYIGLEDLPQKLKIVLRTCVELFYVSQPDMSSNYKYLLMLSFIGAFVVLFKRNCSTIIKSVLLIVCILISSQFTNLMAKTNFSFTSRINFFAQPYIYAVFLAVGLRYANWTKSINLVIMLMALWGNIIQDIRYQKVLYLGGKAEMQVYTDIITRIKQNEHFSNNKYYTLVTTEPLAYRRKFYKNRFDRTEGSAMYPIIPNWASDWFYNFYEANQYIDKYYHLQRNNTSYSIDKLSLPELKHIADFVLNKAQPYPHKNSVYVDDKYIFVIYDEDGLNRAKRYIQVRLKELENKHE